MSISAGLLFVAMGGVFFLYVEINAFLRKAIKARDLEIRGRNLNRDFYRLQRITAFAIIALGVPRNRDSPFNRKKGLDMNDSTFVEKLAGIMRDPELALEVGGLIEDLLLPGFVKSGRITSEARQRLLDIRSLTIAFVSDEVRSQLQNEVALRMTEVSEFVHYRA